MHVLNTLAPILLIIALGAFLRRGGFVSMDFLRQSNRLVYWVGLPALLISKTSQPLASGMEAMRIFSVLVCGMAGCLVLGYLLGWLLRVPRGSLGAFVQGSFRGNLAYIGLPVVLFAIDASPGEAAASFESLAILAIAPLIPIYNAVAVLVLLIGQETAREDLGSRLRQLVVGVVTNPLVLACVLGLSMALLGLEFVPAVGRALDSLGNIALGLVLLGIGGMLTFESIKAEALHATAAALLKIAAAPAIGYVVGRAMGLDAQSLRVALIYLACPTAIMSYIMADQLGNDGELAAGIVMITTLIAFPALAVVLFVTAP